ncbi:MAG TPA: hypothetical protein VGF64_04800 [Acidimicrobiales bacterium]
MPTYTDVVARAQDQFLEALKRAQDRSVGVVESAGRVAAGIVPTRLLTGRLDGAVPPEQVVRLTLGFSERLIAQQRAYAERLVAALDSAGSEARSARTPQPRKAPSRPRTSGAKAGARSNRPTGVDAAATGA